MKYFFTGLLLFTAFSSLRAQQMTPEQYVSTYKDIAISEMKRVGIPASVTLAQGLLETESGNSELVKRSNNHFGLKCKNTWTGETVTHTDDAPNECFRKYTKAEDSYRDHSDYIRATPWYASLFTLEPDDYKGWAYGLKKAGYATNPAYPQILITNIEKYNLHQYDTVGGPFLVKVNLSAPSNVVKTPDTAPVAVVPVASPSPAAVPFTVEANKRFNGLKACYVPRGTSLLAVATAANLPLARLLDFNDLQSDGLMQEDGYLYLEKKNKVGNRDYYTALQNETLYSIAQNNGVQLRALAEINQFPDNRVITKGTKIKLRPLQLTLSN